MNKEGILAEIEQYLRLERRQEGDVSIDDVAQEIGMGRKAASVRMDALIEKEIFKCINVLDDGHWVKIHRKVE